MAVVAGPGGAHGGGADSPPHDVSRARSRGVSPAWATAIVAVVGIVITAALSWTAWTLNRHNEHRLLVVQTHQAAAVLSSTILGLQGPLVTALHLEQVTGGSTAEFARFAATYVGPDQAFVSAVLWRSDGTTMRPVAAAGVAPLLPQDSLRARTLVARALRSKTFVVDPVPTDGLKRIAYAVADPSDPTTVIYAERAIPADRVVPVENGSAFSDLDFATYVGRTADLSMLATTDLPLDQLPISGDTSRVAIPFGDSSVTLVAAPRGALGGTLGGALPWVILVGGVLITVGGAAVTYQLTRRRRGAEHDAATIVALYGRLDGLYGEQRTIAEALQQALLPQRNPPVPNLDVATRYLAGTDGLEIGGDWFSLIEIDDGHFAFAVGDVSGKGVEAAAIMARLRFTVRAYLVEGHAPDDVLAMCSRQLSVHRDGHLATVLVGRGDTVTGTVTFASAGHLDPMLVSDGRATYVHSEVGTPLGVAPSTYTATTVDLTDGAALVVFTDGLVERRGESIDRGLDRLLDAAGDGSGPVEDLVTRLTTALATPSSDDVAVLAFRWTSPTDRPTGGTNGADASE